MGSTNRKSLRRSIRTQGTFWLTQPNRIRRAGQGVRRQLGVAQGDRISMLGFWVTWTMQRWTRKPQSQGWLRSEFRGVRGGSAQEHSLCDPSPATQTPHPLQTTFPRPQTQLHSRHLGTNGYEEHMPKFPTGLRFWFR